MMYTIKETGIDTRNMDTLFPGTIKPETIVTSVIPGNDYVLEPGFPTSGRLIVVVEKDINPSFLLYHLQALHRDKADIVLLNPHTKYLDDYIFLKDEAGYISSLGLYLPENGGEIINFPYKNISAVGINISPLNFDMDIIKYTEEEGIELIGFYDNPLDLPLTFNLSFYARYCKTVILDYTPDYPERIEYLEALIDKESPGELEMRRTIKQEGKLDIGVSLKLQDDLIIQCPDKNTILNPEETVFGLGKYIEKTPEKREPETEFEINVLTLWNGIHEKESYTREELTDMIRYLSVGFLNDRKYNIGKLGRWSFVIVVREKKKIYRNYLFYIKENKELYLQNLQ